MPGPVTGSGEALQDRGKRFWSCPGSVDTI